ncbi:MAG TPA: SCO family protein [Candidatus Limnocylindria bacterium]|jgi:cytochrome oxidase Cu insertion factor (SCO1/SenC/PrrC family)|nr:SCO family protein [Candidatus Limnocylindria bacterium]
MRTSVLAVAAAAISFFGLTAPASAAFPVHGVVLGGGQGQLVIRTQGAPGELPAGTYRWHTTQPGPAPAAGTEVDALVEGPPYRAIDVHPAGAFIAGLPGSLKVTLLHPGDGLPDRTLVDQQGRVHQLSEWRDKSVLLSFIYTRCPDQQICPAISGKFAYLQHHIDPSRTHLVLVSLDPMFDSPSVLARYGAQFDADASRWSLMTGEGAQVKALLDAFGVSSLEDEPGRYIHEDDLVMIRPGGTIAEIIPTAGWAPSDVLAELNAVNGGSGNSLQRLALAAVAGIASLCQGYSVSQIMVELGAIGITFVFAFGLLGWFGWRILMRGD